MELFAHPSLAELLDRQRSRLAEAFGEGGFDVETSGTDQATVRTSLLEVRFRRDLRDGAVSALILLRDPPTGAEAEAEPWLWARFLGVDTPALVRDRNGKIRASAEEQLTDEVDRIVQLALEIFSDPQKLRDAAFFVEGYTRAYNDSYAGKW